MNTDKEKIIEKLDQIAKCIYENTEKMHPHVNSKLGLYSGEFGVLLFMYYYSLYSKNKDYLDSTYSYTDILMGKIGIAIGDWDGLKENYSFSFSNGIAGILYSLKFLTEKEFVEFDFYNYAETIDHLALAMKSFVKDSNYDFLHGALGIGIYLLKVNEYKFVEELIDKLYSSAIIKNSEKIFKWDMKINPLNDFDISLSHGISAIIIFLSRAIKNNISLSKSRKMLTGAINYILSIETDFQVIGSHFPINSGLQKSRLAWCYGDLGIASSIWYAGKITNTESWKHKALTIFIDSAQRLSLNDSHVNDAGICHGSAGIAMIFKRMYIETGNDLFLRTAYKWINQTLEFSIYNDGLAGYKTIWYNELICDLSLLNGISGIGLTFLSFIENDSQDWDELFLLS